MPHRNSFFENVHIDQSTRCWNWTGAMSSGYGVMMVGGKRDKVHRISAWIYKGFDRTSGLQVLHHCDNRKCFNPKHLFIGTHLDNMRDAHRKGRNPTYIRRIRCTRGHEFIVENIYITPDGRRNCRKCLSIANSKYKEKTDALKRPSQR